MVHGEIRNNSQNCFVGYDNKSRVKTSRGTSVQRGEKEKDKEQKGNFVFWLHYICLVLLDING